MEFKGTHKEPGKLRSLVDIGTEWNLKVIPSTLPVDVYCVDIGTEWNLKNTIYYILAQGAELI